MKLIKADQEKFSFQIEKRERQMLFRLLELYPLVPLAQTIFALTARTPLSDAVVPLL